MASHTLGNLEVVVLGEEPPSQPDWDVLCGRIAEVVAAGRLPSRVVLVVTQGGRPNAAQRKQLVGVQTAGVRPRRIAVCSSSALVRGVMTALNWLGLNLKPFHFDELYQAWSWLAPKDVPFGDVEAAVVRAQAENGWRRLIEKPLGSANT